MSERSTEHATFSVERVYEASPERTFAAWSDPVAKAQWFSDPEEELELDFRVGGWERHGGTLPDGREYAYQAVFHDIVQDRRIVYTYEMRLDGVRISVSLATAEFGPDGEGTRLVYTEQGAYFDGHEAPAGREHGMGSLLDLLGKWLATPR
jgi:uncharacterized protein YndB with AHSA1/START domain